MPQIKRPNQKRSTKTGQSSMAIEAWHRRHAIQVAASLPETIEDALVVLELAKELVAGFLSGITQRPDLAALDRDRGNVVSLSSATNGSNR
jgi:hypothetical protein